MTIATEVMILLAIKMAVDPVANKGESIVVNGSCGRRRDFPGISLRSANVHHHPEGKGDTASLHHPT